MSNRIAQARWTTVSSAVLIFLGGCAPEPIPVEYAVSGVPTALITFQTASGSAQEADRALPWSHRRTAHRGEFLYVSAQNAGDAGCVTVRILVKRVAFKETRSCGPYVIAQASGILE